MDSVADWRKSQANLGPNGQVMPYGDHALYHGISAKKSDSPLKGAGGGEAEAEGS